MENAIDSAILGADMPSHVRTLERHFQTHGTPVIIGMAHQSVQSACKNQLFGSGCCLFDLLLP